MGGVLGCPRCLAITVLASLSSLAVAWNAIAQSSEDTPAEHAGVEIHVRADRGTDLGQNFGTLFEVSTRDGKFVIGAGFLGLYNTHYRCDRHAVHLFVRPTSGPRNHTTEPLPRPTDLAGTYLLSRDGTLYSAFEVHSWDESEARWAEDEPSQQGRMRLGDDLLEFDDGTASFNGDEILSKPEQGVYYRFYYAQGHLFFYHTFRAGKDGYRPHTTDAEGFTKLYACPWRPSDDAPVDLGRAVVLTVPFVGETPFSYGQLADDVLTCSNIGGVYVFNGTQWRTVVDATLKASYQVYSMLNFEDRLLMGQYPTGELFEFDGETVTRLDGWPPRIEGVSASAREAQTLTIYGGDLFVGVWPWGEVWRYALDTERWSFVQRMFTHPAPTDETVHPYEKECAAAGPVMNQWGQRVTSFVILGPSLMVSTSAKWPCKWEPQFAFLADGKWKEYGTVSRLTLPGHLSASLAWTDGPTELAFSVSAEGMAITQDGKQLAETPHAAGLPGINECTFELDDIVWGDGVYGKFGGTSLAGQVR